MSYEIRAAGFPHLTLTGVASLGSAKVYAVGIAKLLRGRPDQPASIEVRENGRAVKSLGVGDWLAVEYLGLLSDF